MNRNNQGQNNQNYNNPNFDNTHYNNQSYDQNFGNNQYNNQGYDQNFDNNQYNNQGYNQQYQNTQYQNFDQQQNYNNHQQHYNNQQNYNVPPIYTEEPKKKKSIIPVVLTAIITFVVLVVVLYFGYNKFLKKDNVIDLSTYEVNFVTYGAQGEGKPEVDIKKVPEVAKTNAEISNLLSNPDVSFDKQSNLKNGDKVEVTKEYAKINGKVNSGEILVDGLGVGDIGSKVIKDRQQLSEDGIVIVAYSIDKQTGKILSGPEMSTKGFVYYKDSEDTMKEAQDLLLKKIRKEETYLGRDWQDLKGDVRDLLSRFFYEKLKRNPIILPMLLEI